MTAMSPKRALKDLTAQIPGVAAGYQRLIARGRHPSAGYDLDRLGSVVPAWASVLKTAAPSDEGKHVLVMGSLRWWLEYATALGVLLRSQGHRVDLATLPYRRWTESVSPFDAQRMSTLINNTLTPLSGWMGWNDLSAGGKVSVPPDLEAAMQTQSRIDVQYTLQREDVDWQGAEGRQLYELRLARNRQAAAAALSCFETGRYDVVIIPNGSILEFGAVYRAARYAGLRTVTFEFGEQRERMWLAQDAEVMRLGTDDLWEARGNSPLRDNEEAAIHSLYQARRGARIWKNFSRQWQAEESAGASQVREQLGLDPERPLVLLCTNVVGDSLALDRQLFTEGMEDWLTQTVRFFHNRPDVQLVVRVHPGELLGAGHPSVDIVQQALPELPDHVVVVPPESDVNTYDLIEIAQLGLVYTTTVGMEMAMTGLPVIVSGATHYRGKGFTYDPDTFDAYRSMLETLLSEEASQQLSEDRIELAWRYAHRFFFEYPFPFPWHLISFWEDLEARSLTSIVLEQNATKYRRTLNALVGHPVDWKRVHVEEERWVD